MIKAKGLWSLEDYRSKSLQNPEYYHLIISLIYISWRFHFNPFTTFFNKLFSQQSDRQTAAAHGDCLTPECIQEGYRRSHLCLKCHFQFSERRRVKSCRAQSRLCSSFPFAIITLQSHGLTITQSPGLPVSLAVARIQGFSCFDNSMLTQVRTAVFQSKPEAFCGGVF